jgi:hypothetical protein
MNVCQRRLASRSFPESSPKILAIPHSLHDTTTDVCFAAKGVLQSFKILLLRIDHGKLVPIASEIFH